MTYPEAVGVGTWSLHSLGTLTKAALNRRKHRVTFERAGTIFVDPHAISIPDDEHSEDEDRWVTMGSDATGTLLIVIHTFEELDSAHCRIRLISARKPNKKEARQYAKVQR